MDKKSALRVSLGIWLPLAGLVFGGFCGGATASGAYSVSYFIPLGGGHMLTLLLIFSAMMFFFCTVMLRFIHAYKVTDYNSYYLALYGLQGEHANPFLKKVVTVFFDFHTVLTAISACATAIALFSDMVGDVIPLPTAVTSLLAVALFSFLTRYGAAFLRKFDTVLTVALIIGMSILFVAVLQDRGDIFWERFGNFQEGLDWTGTSLGMGYWTVINFGFASTAWGSTLCSHSDRIRHKWDCYGAGFSIAVSLGLLFLLPSVIVLPYMPEAINNAPILGICQQYMAPWLTVLYWIIVMAALISTGPVFCFNIGKRFSKVWKTDRLKEGTKYFIISIVFLMINYFISFMGMMNIIKIILGALGIIGAPAIAVPLVISIFRIARKERAEKAAQKNN